MGNNCTEWRTNKKFTVICKDDGVFPVIFGADSLVEAYERMGYTQHYMIKDTKTWKTIESTD